MKRIIDWFLNLFKRKEYVDHRICGRKMGYWCMWFIIMNFFTLNVYSTLYFTIDDWVKISNPFYSYGSEITVECWGYTSPQGADSCWISQATEGIDSQATNVFLLYKSGASLVFFFINDSAGSWHSVSFNTTPNKWHHLVGRCNTNSTDLFIDGEQVGTTTGVSAIKQNSGSTIGIGRDMRNANYMTGFVSNVRIYNRRLSNNEIKSNMYNNVMVTNGLVEYWKLDDTVGTRVNDYSGNNKFGNIIGATWVYDNPPIMTNQIDIQEEGKLNTNPLDWFVKLINKICGIDFKV